ICQGAVPSSSAATLIGYHTASFLSTTFLQFFKIYFFIFKITIKFGNVLYLSTPPKICQYHKTNFFVGFSEPGFSKKEALNPQCFHLWQ
ncbi:hypothetical protein, partial [uncultured Acetatifactor sp.]|uniref:hypothetical protein n=1 Tax=uncultured Acetatifactor sp. TaxID=1671927 RepID=UPI00261D2E72